MGRLNAPREIPYEFRVFRLDSYVWLFDASSRSFPCTAVPHIYAEPLYGICEEICDDPDECTGDCLTLPETSGLFLARDVEKRESFAVELDDEYTNPKADEREAWEVAREEANANHRI